MSRTGLTEDVLESVEDTQLFTRGIKDGKEYRVHVFKGVVIDIVEKRRRNGVDESVADSSIRNLANGYVYCREDVSLALNGKLAAISAVVALGLDFGAVDLIYKDDKPYILEVNTAPGLEGTTMTRYVNAITTIGSTGLGSLAGIEDVFEEDSYYDEF
jgi:D-alanine-D-alanine ligase-like ATP-grasp enzyme